MLNLKKQKLAFIINLNLIALLIFFKINIYWIILYDLLQKLIININLIKLTFYIDYTVKKYFFF